METTTPTDHIFEDTSDTLTTMSYSKFQIATIAISVVGITANVIVILVLAITKAYKKGSTKWYILQLAIADAIFLISTTLTVHFTATKSWTIQGCRGVWTVFYMNYHSSVLFIMVMAIDRYSAINHGFSVFGQKLRKRRSVVMITVIVWLISFAASLPAVIYSDTTKHGCKILFPQSNYINTGRHPSCEIAKQSEVEYAYYWFEFVVMFLVPMITTGACYALIVKYSVLSRYRVTGQYLDRKRKRAIVTCAVLVAVFLICWTPQHAKMLALMKGIDATREYCDTLSHVTTVFVYVNSAANPFVYFIMIHVRQHYSTLEAHLERIFCCKDNNRSNKESLIPLSRQPKRSHEASRVGANPPAARQISSHASNTESSPMTGKTSLE